MQLIFLGRETIDGESPTLYATDRGSYLVQGYVVADDDLLATLDVPDGDTVVEVYARLFEHLSHDGVDGPVTRCAPPIVHIRENGNYLVRGARLADEATRRRLAIPEHEDAVEVSKRAVLALL